MLRQLNCQTVAVLDRCTDASGKLIRQHLKNVEMIFKEAGCWNNACAEAKSVGCDVAKELGADLILIADADILLDVEAIQKAKLILESSDCQVVVLPYWQYSLYGSTLSKISNQIQNLFAFIGRRLKIHPVRFGLYIGKADAINIDDVPSEYDNLQEKVKTIWVPTKSLHLRPRLDIENQIKHGMARAERPQYSWLRVIVFSLFTFQPFTLVGYLQAKMKR